MGIQTGDRILEVDGENLREASHERAVEVIRKAGNPVTFMVQSLVDWEQQPDQNITMGVNTDTLPAPRYSLSVDADGTSAGLLLPNGNTTPTVDGGIELPKVAPEPPILPSVTPTPEVIQSGVTTVVKAVPKRQETEQGESEEDDDALDLQGRTVLPNGAEVCLSSPFFFYCLSILHISISF